MVNVVVTQRQTSWIRRLIRAGRYNNQSEVVRDALRRMEDQARVSTPTCEQLADALQKNPMGTEEAKAFSDDLASYRERANTRENGC
jgi:putative addiction module CopG family antidote